MRWLSRPPEMKKNKSSFLAVYFTMTAIAAAAPTEPHPPTAKSMADAANAFIATLSPRQQKEAVTHFDDPQRVTWDFLPDKYLPDNRKRFGVVLKSLNAKQRKSVENFLKTGLSNQGRLKVTAIRELETILREITGNPIRDAELYYFAIFGTPSNEEAWGWRMEGHHISLNYTIIDGKMIATAPQFFGANPAEVKEGPHKGLRVLHAEEDSARKLFDSLDDEQKSIALFRKEVFKEIVTKNLPKVSALEVAGILAADLDKKQTKLLLELIQVYADAMPADLATERLKKIKDAGIMKIHFGWAGSVKRGEKHYYRVQGPSFLIEYCNRQSNANHIHVVWRDFNGDFGRDILREHLRKHH